MQRFDPARRALMLILLALCVATTPACEDDHDGHDGGAHGDGDGDHPGDGDGHTSCGVQANCTGNEFAPAAGDSIGSHNGTFTAMLHHAEDYVSGDGTQVTAHWMVMLKDAAGDPVTGATVTVQTYSVDCGHDGPTAPKDVTANADGQYAIHSTFAHGGPWETRLMVKSGGDMDMVHIPVCVPGDEHGGSHSDPDAGTEHSDDSDHHG